MSYNQSKWLYDILQDHGFDVCVDAFKQNISVLERKDDLDKFVKYHLKRLSIITVNRQDYLQDEIRKCEKTMRDSIDMAHDEMFCSVYNVVDIIYNYVAAEAVKSELLVRNKECSGRELQNAKPQQKRKSARSKGRPKETLKDKMINDADGSKLQKVHTVMNGKIGKEAALIILACIKKGWMLMPTFTQVAEEFGDIGTQQGFTIYLHEKCFTNGEIEGAINSLD